MRSHKMLIFSVVKHMHSSNNYIFRLVIMLFFSLVKYYRHNKNSDLNNEERCLTTSNFQSSL